MAIDHGVLARNFAMARLDADGFRVHGCHDADDVLDSKDVGTRVEPTGEKKAAGKPDERDENEEAEQQRGKALALTHAAMLARSDARVEEARKTKERGFPRSLKPVAPGAPLSLPIVERVDARVKGARWQDGYLH